MSIKKLSDYTPGPWWPTSTLTTTPPPTTTMSTHKNNTGPHPQSFALPTICSVCRWGEDTKVKKEKQSHHFGSGAIYIRQDERE